MGIFGKLFGWGEKELPKPEVPGGQTLTDLTRGMQHAVNRAQEILERHYIEVLDRYFDTDKDKKQYPKMITFKVDGADVHFPLITFVPPGGLTLDKMKIRMAVRIDKADLKKAGPKGYEGDDHLTRTSMQVSFASLGETTGGKRNTNAIEMTMFFKAGDPPEGVSRVLEQYVNSIRPADRKEPPPQGAALLTNGAPSPPGTEDGGNEPADADEHPVEGPEEGGESKAPNPDA